MLKVTTEIIEKVKSASRETVSKGNPTFFKAPLREVLAYLDKISVEATQFTDAKDGFIVVWPVTELPAPQGWPEFGNVMLEVEQGQVTDEEYEAYVRKWFPPLGKNDRAFMEKCLDEYAERIHSIQKGQQQ